MRTATLCLSSLIFAAALSAQTGVHPTVRTVTATPSTSTSGSGHPKATAPAVRFKPEIPASAPIFTLDGVCPPPAKDAKPAAECKTVITRGQLDALVAALDPDASAKAHQQFALSYARLIAATTLAEKRHLEKDPAIAREIQLQQTLVRMQILTNHMLQGLQTQASKIADTDVEAYYKKNQSNFEQADVSRVAVPLNAQTESGQPLDAAAVKAKIEELRDRATKGDDFDTLQARAYKELGVKGGLPRTNLNIVRRQTQSPEEVHVFAMDLGEISPLIENDGIIMIIRLNSKRQLTLEQARPQIEASLELQNITDDLKTAFKGVGSEFNLKYMEVTTQPDLFPASVVTQNQFHRGLIPGTRGQP